MKEMIDLLIQTGLARVLAVAIAGQIFLIALRAVVAVKCPTCHKRARRVDVYPDPVYYCMKCGKVLE